MKNFSLKRMAQVMRITFCQNHKWFLNIGIAYLLAHFVGQALVFYTISNSPEAPDWYIAGRMHNATGAFVMISALLILGGISFTFDVLKDKNKRIAILMLPASNAEKSSVWLFPLSPRNAVAHSPNSATREAKKPRLPSATHAARASKSSRRA